MISNCLPFSLSSNDRESILTTTTAISSTYVANRPRSMSLSFLEVSEDRDELLEELSQYKSHLVELTSQMDEVEREMHNETELLRAELKTADRDTYVSDRIINDLDRTLDECRQLLNDCNKKLSERKERTEKEMAERKRMLEGCVSEAYRHRLRRQVGLIEQDDDEMRTSIIQQAEMFEIDEKVNEIMEFEILEEKTNLMARKEMLTKKRAAAVAERHIKRSHALDLQINLDQLQCEGKAKLRCLRSEIKNVTQFIKQGHKILKDMDEGVFRPLHKSMPNLDEISPTTHDPPAKSERDGGSGNRTAEAYDLRAHMELLGHRMSVAVTADNHFRINGWSCHGFLKKLSRGYSGRSYLLPVRGSGRKWQNRWFVFDRRSGTFSYYRRKSDEENAVVAPRHSICFQDIWDVSVAVRASNEDKVRHKFVVKTLQRTLHLSAATDQAMRFWMDVIYYGASEGNCPAN